MTLCNLIKNSCPLDEIADYLDQLPSAERLAQTRSLNRGMQRALFDLAHDGAPLSLEDYVPSDVPALTGVVHKGFNTLPAPRLIREFEKRFCRPRENNEVLYGYNEGFTRPLIGPGYFLMRECSGDWLKFGSVVVDYFSVPSSEVPQDWPKVKHNHQGLQIFVYHKMHDFMRRVSKHVSIGAPYKNDKPLGQFFILCRQD